MPLAWQKAWFVGFAALKDIMVCRLIVMEAIWKHAVMEQGTSRFCFGTNHSEVKSAWMCSESKRLLNADRDAVALLLRRWRPELPPPLLVHFCYTSLKS